MSSEATEVARIHGRHALLIAFVGAVSAIAASILSSELLRDYVKRVALNATPQETLKKRLDIVTAERDRVVDALAKGKANAARIDARNNFLEKDMATLLSQKGVPPSRLAVGYRIFDGSLDDCRRIGAAALRLATNGDTSSVASGAMFSTVGSYKAAIVCFPDDKFVVFLGVGPEWQHATELSSRTQAEFRNINGK